MSVCQDKGTKIALKELCEAVEHIFGGDDNDAEVVIHGVLCKPQRAPAVFIATLTLSDLMLPFILFLTYLSARYCEYISAQGRHLCSHGV